MHKDKRKETEENKTPPKTTPNHNDSKQIVKHKIPQTKSPNPDSLTV